MKLPQWANKVTPFSKWLTMAFFIAFSIIAFYSGIHYAVDKIISVPQKNQIIRNSNYSISAHTESPSYKLINKCSSKECLYNPSQGSVEGFATLQGYYYDYKSEEMGKILTCQSIIVTGGSEVLINHFRELIRKGNSINKIVQNNLVVNIDLANLDNNMKQKLLASNINKQMKFNVIRTTPFGRRVSTCASFIEIISVEDFIN